jgi:hypothetical protein
MIEHSDCVGVLPFLNEIRLMMVRQYSYIFDEDQRWEMPTGKVKANEVSEFPFYKVKPMVLKSEICDSMTVIVALLADRLRRRF